MSKICDTMRAVASLTQIAIYLVLYAALGICLYILARYAMWEMFNV